MLERFLFVITLIATVPLMLLWFGIPVLGGMFIGLPIAGIKFVLTGKSGIDWYMGTVLDYVMMKWPIFIWEDSIKRRERT